MTFGTSVNSVLSAVAEELCKKEGLESWRPSTSYCRQSRCIAVKDPLELYPENTVFSQYFLLGGI